MKSLFLHLGLKKNIKNVKFIKTYVYILCVYNVYGDNTINNLVNLRDALSVIIDYKNNPIDFKEWLENFKGMIEVDL